MFNLKAIHILILALSITILSCNRIKKESHRAIDKTKETIVENKDNIGDKIIARYDAYTPDTKYNKKRFTEFFKFEPTQDVKNIYCYADEMGIDQDYQFAFNCDISTVNKIVGHLQLIKANKPDNFSNGLWHNFGWWDSTKIVTLKPYWKKGEHEAYWYLWYDSSKQKVYYFMFDM